MEILKVQNLTKVYGEGDTQVKALNNVSFVSTTGFWHVGYKEISSETSEYLKQEKNTRNISFYKDLGYSKFENSTNEYKPYLYLSAMDDKSYDMMNMKLVEGNYPVNSREIVIPKHLLQCSNKELKIGDKLTVTLGNRYINVGGEKQYLDQYSDFVKESKEMPGEEFEITSDATVYTIVGIIERPNYEYSWSPAFSVFTKIEDYNQCNARVYLNNVSKHIYEETNDTADKYDILEVEYNNSALSYYGISRYSRFNTMMDGLVVILVIIIMVGSISLIYNSFAISTSERTMQFGMLASVGATKRQKLYTVLYEGVICGCISIPIGILSGIVGLSITFSVISSMIESAFHVEQNLTVVVSWQGMIASIIISMITILLSAYIPARKASKITPMEAIRQQKDIKIKSKNVKNMKLIRKLLGLEGDLALKNLKRNKKRYRAIVFSLGISIILFISVNSYTHYLSKSIEIVKDKNSGDLVIGGISEDDINTVLPEISSLDTITDIVLKGYVPGNYQLSKEEYNQYATEELKEFNKLNGMSDTQLGFSINVVDNETYEKLQIQTHVVQLNESSDTILVMLVNQQRTSKNYSLKDIKPLNISNGTVLEVSQNNAETKNEKLKLAIEGQVVDLPLGMNYPPVGNEIVVIISKMTCEQLLAGHEEMKENMYYTIIANTTDPDNINNTLSEIFSRVLPSSNAFISNQAQDAMRSRQIITIFNIFAYGFIILISLISVANICNTISTSFSIRRREFAMIKSVGMTPASFHKMIVLESLLYGLKSLLLGIPIGAVFNFLIYQMIDRNINSNYGVPYMTYIIAIIFVFLIVGIAMLYSTSKIRKDNIIDGLKSEII